MTTHRAVLLAVVALAACALGAFVASWVVLILDGPSWLVLVAAIAVGGGAMWRVLAWHDRAEDAEREARSSRR